MTDSDRIHKLRVAVRMAANTFRTYEQLHMNKGTDEGRRKAEENAEQARHLEKVLEDTKGVKS